MSPPSSALVIRFAAGTTAALRDRLVGLLSEYELLAVQEDDLNAPTLWTAHFETSRARAAALEAIAKDPELHRLDVSVADVEDEDWARRTQADLPAVKIGRIVVAPPWDLPKPALIVPDPTITVLIEPSRGFGTGHHQSTRLCVALLQARDLSGLRVIDVGTGSGVLAIVAARLGAATVLAIDNDPDAVENAHENIVANQVGATVDADVQDLSSTTIGPGDLVTANLTGTLLARHASDLARLVRIGGSAIVSGFNVEESARVSEAVRPYFTTAETAEEDDWHAFVLVRSGS